jgi:phenylpropionate dioxygenase-like ring-hydroxylating dioxygenase large terminal subunit
MVTEFRWLKDSWQVAAIAAELDGGLVARTVMEEPLLLFRGSDGTATALEDRCPHRLAPLSKGRLVDGIVVCGYHGMRFGADGRCVGIPGQDSIPARARVRRYPAVEQHGWIWVWLGNEADADPALIPSEWYHWPDAPGWRTIHGYTHFACNYQLLVDNLLDLSHETFVHQETIGNSAVADSPVSAEIVDDRYVRAARFMPDCEPAPMFRAVNGFAQRIDRWHTTLYRPPSYVLVESGACPAGSPERAGATERRTMFPLTAETRWSTHMFWSVARNNALDDAEIETYLREKTALTQEQDRAMLEAQQRSIGERIDPDFPVAIRVDAGPTLGRRLHERVLGRELQRV